MQRANGDARIEEERGKSAENPGAAEESEEKRAQEAAGQATPGYKSGKL
jgi:hypothetical protein